MRAVSALLCAGWCCTAQPALDIGDRRQLLMDGRFVRDARGVEVRVHEPRKTGDITIPEEEGWGLGGYSSVLWHAGVYHMWYTAHTAVCYARSADGIRWERPRFSLAALAKHPESSIVLGYGAGGVKGPTHGVMVFIDPHAPDSERFRLVANPHEFTRMLQLFSSPDGIHWKRTHKNIIACDEAKRPHHLDTQNWRSASRRYPARAARRPGRSASHRASSPRPRVIDDTAAVVLFAGCQAGARRRAQRRRDDRSRELHSACGKLAQVRRAHVQLRIRRLLTDSRGN